MTMQYNIKKNIKRGNRILNSKFTANNILGSKIFKSSQPGHSLQSWQDRQQILIRSPVSIHLAYVFTDVMEWKSIFLFQKIRDAREFSSSIGRASHLLNESHSKKKQSKYCVTPKRVALT